ncbi:MAG: YHS domain-containing (seleno)protein [Roseiarcus sp.]
MLILAGPAFAGAVNASSGFAIGGYDPVAYFTDGKPAKGSFLYQYRWHDATWLFASAELRDAFTAAPEKYAPQYGGFCAYAVSHNSTADIDPAAWSIVDGKLYLNYNKVVRVLWNQDIPGHIAAGDKNWPGLEKK